MCQLFLKELFGYWEDISVAPGLSDSQGHRGIHVMLENTEAAEEKLEVLLFAMQENAAQDINHAEVFLSSHTRMDSSAT